MSGEQGTREEKTRGDGTGRDKTRQRVTEQEGTREEKTRGDGTRGDKRREERSCYTIPHTDKRSFRIHGSRGHFTRRQLTPRALNARVHSSPTLVPIKKGVRFSGPSGLRRPRCPPWARARATRRRPGATWAAQEHPRATQDHPGRPKSRPRDAKTAPGAAKRAPGAPGRLPGDPQHPQKRRDTFFYEVS